MTLLRKVLLAGLALALASTDASFAASEKQWDACADKGDVDRALEVCTEIIDSGNETRKLEALAYSNRCSMHLKKLNYDQAIADCSEAILLDATLLSGFWGRAMARSASGALDLALEDLNAALALSSTETPLLAERGWIYSQKLSFDLAIADYSAALKLTPEDVKLLVARGNAYLESGETSSARADFDEAVRLDPANVSAHVFRGCLLEKISDVEGAIAAFTEAIRLEPDNYDALIRRGEAYRRSDRYDSAIADFTAVLRTHPNDPAALNDRGAAYQQSGKLDLAMADFRTALNITPRLEADREHYAYAQSNLEALRQHAGSASATEASQGADQPGPVQPRVALVIGNSQYAHVARLANPKRDAEAVGESLRRLGFKTVNVQVDLSADAMRAALRAFSREAGSAEWAVVYFSGHGIEVGGLNYLIPVDARLERDSDVDLEAIALEQVMASVDGASKLRMVILDACRDSAFANAMQRTASTRSVGRGLARVEPQGATLVAYAAKGGQVALDGDGAHSPYVTALLRHIEVPGIEVGHLFRIVRDEVMTSTGSKQEPFVYGSLPAEQFFFRAN